MMLVLTRKIGETVCIGADIELVVLDAGRGRVKIGFAGPRDVAIRRGELVDPLPSTETAQSTPLAAPVAAGQRASAPLHRFRALATH